MTRNEEHEVLMKKIHASDVDTDAMIKRAVSKRRRSTGATSAVASVMGLFVAFVLLINIFPSVAYAMGRIPVLREMADALTFSTALNAAVDNEYVQPINSTKTQDGITMTVDYLIVDSSQINVFFTLKSEEYGWFETQNKYYHTDGSIYSTEDGVHLGQTESGSVAGHSFVTDPEYSTGVPSEITFVANVYGLASVDDYVPDPDNTDYTTTFEFDFKFDPNHIDTGEFIATDAEFELEGQTLRVSEISVFPTNATLTIEEDEANEYDLTQLYFDVVDSAGNEYRVMNIYELSMDRHKGTTSRTYEFETPYFGERELTLRIGGADWLEKDAEKVRIDLQSKTAHNLPEAITLTDVRRNDGDTELVFEDATEMSVFPIIDIFYGGVYDAQGNEIRISGSSGGIGYGTGMGENSVTYENLGEDVHEIYLDPTFTFRTQYTDFENIPLG